MAGMDPGPWTYGELMNIIKGRQNANRELAALVWLLGFGDGKERPQIVRGEQAEVVWAQASRFLKKRKG